MICVSINSNVLREDVGVHTVHLLPGFPFNTIYRAVPVEIALGILVLRFAVQLVDTISLVPIVIVDSTQVLHFDGTIKAGEVVRHSNPQKVWCVHTHVVCMVIIQ